MKFSLTQGKALLVAALIATLTSPAARSADVATEHAVRVAIVTKITKFVSWPDGALGEGDAPIRFCVADNREIFDAFLELRNHEIKGRPMSIQLVSAPPEAARDCDVLYMSDSGIDDPSVWLAEISTQPILTFGESSDFSIVTITIRRKKVRFSINTQASDKAGLDIGAQLLQLAALSNRRGS